MGTNRVYIAVNGCHENHMDAALVQRFLGEHGNWEEAPDLEHADVILVQGCAVTQHMEDESRDMIAHLRQAKRPEARLIVTGCVAKANPALTTGDAHPDLPLVAIDHLMYDMDANARRLAVNRLHEKPAEVCRFLTGRKEEVFQNYTGVSRRTHGRGLASKAFHFLFRAVQRYKDFVESRLDPYNDHVYAIKISTGCMGECTYCSVRLTRGTVRSKTIEEVLGEFQRGLDLGYQHFALIGTDIAYYGRDLGLDLIDLLRRIVACDAPLRVRLRNLNPRWVIDCCEEFCRVLRSGKISFAQVAIQSGNDRILGLMKRGYRARDFLAAIAKVRRACPRLVLRTQIIAGFPTETEEEFQDSVAVIDSGQFDYADFFRYTHRAHTSAAKIGPDVPFNVILRRYRTLFIKALFRHPLKNLSAVRRMRTVKVRG